MRHFLRDDDLSPAEQAEVLDAGRPRSSRRRTTRSRSPARSTVAMIFDKPTLRTQASFAAGIAELGGYPMLVDGALAGIGVRESVADVARVLGRQASLIVWRTYEQARIEEMAAHAGVPVVNALTDDFHPCQLLADLLTVREHKGDAGRADASPSSATAPATWATRGCSPARPPACTCGSARPRATCPTAEMFERARRIAADTGGSVDAVTDPARRSPAPTSSSPTPGSRWARRTRPRPRARDLRAVRGHRASCSAHAKPDAIVLHCLPAYRGKEIAAEVIDGPQSVVWDEAENRRHAQKAILTFLLGGDAMS